MNIIDKILSKLKGGNHLSYQDKRDSEQNWQMIEEHLDGTANNLLDIACDRGFYSFKASEKGLFTVGFDILDYSIQRAWHQTKLDGRDNVAFMKLALSPDNVSTLPMFDVVLCLSVYHHFFRLFGEEKARHMVADIFSHCSKQMFFQIPSKIGKFGEGFSCDFKGDQKKIEEYVHHLFDEIGKGKVSLIGKKKEKPPTEEFRYLFLIERKK